MARIAIRHPADPSRPKTIPGDQYNPDRHELWGAEEATEAEETDVATEGLPEGFPAREQLEAAGYTRIHDVRAIADYDEIPGIGQKREQQIVSFFADLEAQEE